MSRFMRWFPVGTNGDRFADRRSRAARPAPEELEGRLLLRCSLGSTDVPVPPQSNGIETWGVDRENVHYSPGWPAHPVVAHHGVDPDSPCWRFDVKGIDPSGPSVRASMTRSLARHQPAGLSVVGQPHRVSVSVIGQPLKARPSSSK